MKSLRTLVGIFAPGAWAPLLPAPEPPTRFRVTDIRLPLHTFVHVGSRKAFVIAHDGVASILEWVES